MCIRRLLVNYLSLLSYLLYCMFVKVFDRPQNSMDLILSCFCVHTLPHNLGLLIELPGESVTRVVSEFKG